FLKGQPGNQISSAISVMEIPATFAPEHRALNLMRHAKSSKLRNHGREVTQMGCFVERFQSYNKDVFLELSDLTAVSAPLLPRCGVAPQTSKRLGWFSSAPSLCGSTNTKRSKSLEISKALDRAKFRHRWRYGQ